MADSWPSLDPTSQRPPTSHLFRQHPMAAPQSAAPRTAATTVAAELAAHVQARRRPVQRLATVSRPIASQAATVSSATTVVVVNASRMHATTTACAPAVRPAMVAFASRLLPWIVTTGIRAPLTLAAQSRAVSQAPIRAGLATTATPARPATAVRARVALAAARWRAMTALADC